MVIHYAEARPSKFLWIGPLSPNITLDKLEPLLASYGRLNQVKFAEGKVCHLL